MDDTLQIVASLAGKFGPYLFAVLVTLFVVKPALVAYIESTKGDFDRKTTQSSAKLWIFVGSSVVAIVLILSGSIWWWKHATRNMVIFTGRIVAVEDQIRILSTDLFILDTSMKLSPFISQSSDANNPSQDEMGESTLIREVSFATWNEKPFSDTKTFHLYLVKPDDPTHDRRPVVIEYTTDDEPVYEIVTRKGKYYLERFYPKTGRDSVRMEWDRFATIFQASAQDNSYNPDSRVVAAKEIENATSGESVRKMETIIEDLQEERTGAGGKAYLLETISGGDGETVEKYMMSYTEREPFAVTVLDLTHHTDEEVSSAAKALLDRFDLDSFVGREIASEELIRQVRAGEILTRFSEDSIQELVGKGLIPKGTVLEPQIMLIPTASADGDRYYVKATWEGEGEVFQCLTKLFNEELLAERTLRQEHQVMKQLGGRRYVYWYSKNWALYIAHKIRQCGGNAIFVDGIKFEPCVNC